MKQISIDKLNAHLFETIEMLKNNTDPRASKNEKIDVETAKTIAEIGKVVIDGYKVKAQVLKMMKPVENPHSAIKLLNDSGMFDINNKMLGE